MLVPEKQKRKTADEELAIFQATHTFKNHSRCNGQGQTGKLLTGPEKGRYVPCSCAKKKPDIANIKQVG